MHLRMETEAGMHHVLAEHANRLHKAQREAESDADGPPPHIVNQPCHLISQLVCKTFTVSTTITTMGWHKGTDGCEKNVRG